MAALDLTPNLPADKKTYYLQKGVGHYGVFNGSRFRSEIAPRIRDFILTHGRPNVRTGAVPVEPPAPVLKDPAPVAEEVHAHRSEVSEASPASTPAAPDLSESVAAPSPPAVPPALEAALPHATPTHALHAELVASAASIPTIPATAKVKRKGKTKSKV